MRKKIRSVSDLPEWFCLDKYEEAINLNAEGWLIQLSWRFGLLILLDQSKSIWKIDEPIPIEREYLKSALEFVRNT
ncbi:MAG: hypothetical protein H0V39_04580, partial [Nitrosomonas sp.]|nr:hypothetical protein [Nitrosomonas sp.]